MERLTNSSSLLQSLSQIGGPCRLAPSLPRPGLLASRHHELDRFLAGGLPFASVVEVGSPLGLGGRRPLIEFVAAATQGRTTPMPCWVLWIYTHSQIYPPAWMAHGVDLSRLCFVRSERPMTELKPALLSPLFRMIVFDAPAQLSADDTAFLAHQARRQDKLILLLRNHRLSPDGRSIWSKLRLNSWRQPGQPGAYRLEVIRGLSPRSAVIQLDQGPSLQERLT